MKYCPNCGSRIMDDAQKFCMGCGYDMTAVKPSTLGQPPMQPADGQGTYQTVPPTYANSIPTAGQIQPAPLPMKWFNFLIYFSLFFSAAVNALMSVVYFTGWQYEIAGGVTAEAVYDIFGGLWYCDVLIGVGSLAAAVFAVFTRFALSGYKTYGPKCLYALYIVSSGMTLMYKVATQWVMIMSPYVDKAETVGGVSSMVNDIISAPFSCFVIVILNYAYFKKRRHLFVN